MVRIPESPVLRWGGEASIGCPGDQLANPYWESSSLSCLEFPVVVAVVGLGWRRPIGKLMVLSLVMSVREKPNDFRLSGSRAMGVCRVASCSELRDNSAARLTDRREERFGFITLNVCVSPRGTLSLVLSRVVAWRVWVTAALGGGVS